MSIIDTMKSLTDITDIPRPGGNYKAVNVRSSNGTIAIQLPIDKGEFHFRGSLGKEISTEHGYQAARMCAMNAIKQLIDHIKNLDEIEISHIDIMYQCEPDWDEAPRVADGASDLFVQVFGAKGEHTRAISGVAKLPRNFSVAIVTSFVINQQL